MPQRILNFDWGYTTPSTTELRTPCFCQWSGMDDTQAILTVSGMVSIEPGPESSEGIREPKVLTRSH